MNSIVSTLSTVAQFSDDGSKRYLLQKTWDKTKPSLAIIMMCPSTASIVTMDSTTLLCVNNAERLGFGSIAIVNLFATLNDYDLKEAEDEDAENLKVIVDVARTADKIIYAAGVGKCKNKAFQARQEEVLIALLPFEDKLHCLCASDGSAKMQHPLSPALRNWTLSQLKVRPLLNLPKDPDAVKKDTVAKNRGKTRIAANATTEDIANEIIQIATGNETNP